MHNQGRQLCQIVLPLSEKGSTAKGKTLQPLSSKAFLLEWIPFRKGLDVQESKQEVTKAVSLVSKMAEHQRSVSSLLSYKRDIFP